MLVMPTLISSERLTELATNTMYVIEQVLYGHLTPEKIVKILQELDSTSVFLSYISDWFLLLIISYSQTNSKMDSMVDLNIRALKTKHLYTFQFWKGSNTISPGLILVGKTTASSTWIQGCSLAAPSLDHSTSPDSLVPCPGGVWHTWPWWQQLKRDGSAASPFQLGLPPCHQKWALVTRRKEDAQH